MFFLLRTLLRSITPQYWCYACTAHRLVQWLFMHLVIGQQTSQSTSNKWHCMSMEVRPFADLCPQANTLFLLFVSKHSICQQRQAEDKCGVRYTVWHWWLVSVCIFRLCLYSVWSSYLWWMLWGFCLMLQSSLTHLPHFCSIYIGRWSTQHVCTLDGLLVLFFWCLHMKGETHSALIWPGQHTVAVLMRCASGKFLVCGVYV